MLRILSTVLILGSAASLLFLFQNCGTGFQATNHRSQTYDVVKLNSLRALTNEDKSSICDEPANYKCVQRFYAPQVSSGESQQEQCFMISGLSTRPFCLPVKVVIYNTDHALSVCADCTESDRYPGGRYNYEESHCYNHRLETLSGVRDRFDSSSIEHALSSAHFACVNLLHSKSETR